MEVIKKERVKELFESHYTENTLTESLEKSIMDACEEIDTLTVSKLRTMCDAKIMKVASLLISSITLLAMRPSGMAGHSSKIEMKSTARINLLGGIQCQYASRRANK